ncbi:hypothetical protein PHMEG_0007017 [Phytophthora megakarya]|uniref:C2H2-type domain-containing protein n=1 Tax=Phytophthora megakarya TaxID=4795 RepID=A0A225WMG3_9STRA|nr:hypothetical protein PHMEG_0007017 [Phytophthora megakarya]
MQKSVEQVRVLTNGKCVRKYSPEHPLFDAGTRLWATKYYQEPESMVQLEESDEQTTPITCQLAKCNVKFQSVAAYEEHYAMVHRNICRECSRSFLSLRLLDIHISETHDAFFKLLSKKKPMYVCLVDGCPDTFKHDDKRTRHLVKVHQYQESFSSQQHRKQQGKEKRNKGKEKRSVDHDEKDAHPEVDAQTAKKREARKRRRQQKKKKLAEQTKRQGSEIDVGADMQDVDADANNEMTQSKVTDVDMADLEERMQELRIPKNIHFGRKRRI